MNLWKLVNCLPSHATKAVTIWPNGIPLAAIMSPFQPYMTVKPRQLAGKCRENANWDPSDRGLRVLRLADNSSTTHAALHMPTIEPKMTHCHKVFPMNNGIVLDNPLASAVSEIPAIENESSRLRYPRLVAGRGCPLDRIRDLSREQYLVQGITLGGSVRMNEWQWNPRS
jgi:hypothetical protein